MNNERFFILDSQLGISGLGEWRQLIFPSSVVSLASQIHQAGASGLQFVVDSHMLALCIVSMDLNDILFAAGRVKTGVVYSENAKTRDDTLRDPTYPTDVTNGHLH